MEKDVNKTDVIFRVDTTKDFKGDVVAVFPHNVETLEGNVGYYIHVGQHSHGDYQRIIQTSRPATEDEAKDLKAELENHFGYNFNVIKRRNYDKYLESYYSVRKIYNKGTDR
jgi:hypothetical protein